MLKYFKSVFDQMSFETARKTILPIIALGMIMGASQTASAGIGDSAVLTDSFGRTWYNPFDGLSKADLGGDNTYLVQFNAITIAGPQYIQASLFDVATMYCDVYHGVDISGGGTCSADDASFDSYAQAFSIKGSGLDSVNLTQARTTTLNGTNLTRGTLLYNEVKFLDNSKVLGTILSNISITSFDYQKNLNDTYGFMYYTQAPSPAPLPSIMGLLASSLIFMGITAYRRKGLCV